MSQMQLTEVNDKVSEKAFLQVNAMMNRSNPVYIQPLDNEVMDVFNPNKNKAFKYGKAIRWILRSNDGKLIGRIAAFTNTKYTNDGDKWPVGCCGFFDCINDQQAADILFDTAKNWLQQQGMQAMDGPVNFGERDKWWGLMVEGFEEEPLYGISFNPPYYEQLFDGYGFYNFYNQFYYQLPSNTVLAPKYEERHAKLSARADYKAIHADKKQLPKFAMDFTTIYNAAWAQHKGGKEITYEAALKLFTKMKPVMDESLVWFAYYKNEPIAMWINIPDLNQYFKYFNGKFGWWQKLQLLWLMQFRPCRKINGLAFGIVPRFQAQGVDAFMIYEGGLFIKKTEKYDQIEMGWGGDWNPKMIGIYKALGGIQSRRMITYRYNFDAALPKERHPVI